MRDAAVSLTLGASEKREPAFAVFLGIPASAPHEFIRANTEITLTRQTGRAAVVYRDGAVVVYTARVSPRLVEGGHGGGKCGEAVQDI